MKTFSIFSTVFVFYALIRIPLHQLAGAIDSAGRMYSLLLLFLLVIAFLYSKLRTLIFKKPIIFWVIWIVYALVNTLTQGLNFDMQVWQFFTFLIAPLALLFFISLNYKEMIKYITLSSYLALLIIFFLESSVYYKGEGFRLGERINSNEIGLDAALTLLFIILFQRVSKMSYLLLFVLAILPSYIILSTGSRSALISLFIIAVFNLLLYLSTNIIKTITLFILLLFIGFFSLNYLENKSVGFQRLKTTKEEGEIVVKTGTILDNLGSRGIYYVFGWEIFTKNPLFGVGLGNYKFHNTYSKQPNHVELMIQLSELGIIGFLLFLVFNLWIAKNLLTIWIRNRNNKELRQNTEFFVVAFITIFSMTFTTYTYRSVYVFATYGLILGHIFDQLKYKINPYVLRA